MVSGRPPSDEESFYTRWARETLKRNINLANEILKQLVTLNTALLGGSVLFLAENMMPGPLRFLAILSFFAALIVSFFGVLPYEAHLDIKNVTAIRNHKQRALHHKRKYLWGSALCSALGFGFVIAGLLSDQLCT
jgi:type III secretory pathway component EscV